VLGGAMSGTPDRKHTVETQTVFDENSAFDVRMLGPERFKYAEVTDLGMHGGLAGIKQTRSRLIRGHLMLDQRRATTA
jgi:hypothetical protein